MAGLTAVSTGPQPIVDAAQVGAKLGDLAGDVGTQVFEAAVHGVQTALQPARPAGPLRKLDPHNPGEERR